MSRDSTSSRVSEPLSGRHSQGGLRASRPPPPIGLVVPARDPLTSVMNLGSRVAMRGLAIGLLFTLLVHGTAAARAALIPLELIRWAQDVRAGIRERLIASYEIDLLKAAPASEPPPAPTEPDPAPEPAPKVKAALVPSPVKELAKEPEPPPPPPPAAQAGALLIDPNEPIDLTGEGFATGAAANFAGGVTHSQGTSPTAVHDRHARPDGTPGGVGTAPGPAVGTPDRSRPATRSGSSDWKCPWPSEADAEQIDDAYVTVQISVKPDGHAAKVNVINDPGHGFGREARLCAMRETYNNALDRDGIAIPGETRPFRIHFER